MSTKKLAEAIGKEGRLRIDNLLFDVKIVDVRPRFGRTDYLVQPMNGAGQQWIESHRITLKD